KCLRNARTAGVSAQRAPEAAQRAGT
ncbi:hypothetical protein A2U01_0093794, partial [Trifolium medium]|nr:hypothetical protein [Trifolium medium]